MTPLITAAMNAPIVIIAVYRSAIRRSARSLIIVENIADGGGRMNFETLK